MEDLKSIAPCGVDCFNCGAYEENMTELIRKNILKMSGKEYINACKGCRGMNGKNLPMADECETYKCILIHKVDFCNECAEFPCGKLSPCADKANFVPHNMKVFNLCRMKKVGIDKWVEESKSIREKYFKGEFVPGDEPVLKK